MKFYPSLLLNFSTKQNGNLAFHVGDNPDTVIQNHKKLAQELGYTYSKLIHMKQIHSNHIKVIDKEDNFYNPPVCDALITNKPATPLMVMVADCSPVLFYDPQKHVVAAAHAGRAGAFNNIVSNVIHSFRQEFHSHAANIEVEVGPSICTHCYEIKEDVVKEAHLLRLDYAVTQENNSFYLDIRKILKRQLLDAGIIEENITISPVCNRCHDNYFSYREEKSCGRFAGIIGLR